MAKYKQKYFNNTEKEILRFLFSSRRYLTIREVAEEVGVSWATARKYLEDLEKRGFLEAVE